MILSTLKTTKNKFILENQKWFNRLSQNLQQRIPYFNHATLHLEEFATNSVPLAEVASIIYPALFPLLSTISKYFHDPTDKSEMLHMLFPFMENLEPKVLNGYITGRNGRILNGNIMCDPHNLAVQEVAIKDLILLESNHALSRALGVTEETQHGFCKFRIEILTQIWKDDAISTIEYPPEDETEFALKVLWPFKNRQRLRYTFNISLNSMVVYRKSIFIHLIILHLYRARLFNNNIMNEHDDDPGTA